MTDNARLVERLRSVGRPGSNACEAAGVIEEQDAAIDHLRVELARLRQLLHDVPYLIIDRRVAELRDEKEALAYADKLAAWAPRAKAALSPPSAGVDEDGGER